MNYFRNALISIDQAAGALLFGIHADETISSYVGRKGPKWAERAIDFIFGEGHCKDAYEDHSNCKRRH